LERATWEKKKAPHGHSGKGGFGQHPPTTLTFPGSGPGQGSSMGGSWGLFRQTARGPPRFSKQPTRMKGGRTAGVARRRQHGRQERELCRHRGAVAPKRRPKERTVVGSVEGVAKKSARPMGPNKALGRGGGTQNGWNITGEDHIEKQGRTGPRGPRGEFVLRRDLGRALPTAGEDPLGASEDGQPGRGE